MLTNHRHERKHADVDIKKYLRTHIDMLFWYSKYLRNNKIMWNFSRDMPIFTLCQSFLYYDCNTRCTSSCVVYPCSFCAMNIIGSIVSITSPRSMYGKHTKYHSATEQRMVFVQKFQVVLYIDMLSTFQDFFTDMLTWKKISSVPMLQQHFNMFLKLCICKVILLEWWKSASITFPDDLRVDLEGGAPGAYPAIYICRDKGAPLFL